MFHGLKSFGVNLMSEIKVGDLVRHSTMGYVEETGLVIERKSVKDNVVMWSDGDISHAWADYMLELVSDGQT